MPSSATASLVAITMPCSGVCLELHYALQEEILPFCLSCIDCQTIFWNCLGVIWERKRDFSMSPLLCKMFLNRGAGQACSGFVACCEWRLPSGVHPVLPCGCTFSGTIVSGWHAIFQGSMMLPLLIFCLISLLPSLIMCVHAYWRLWYSVPPNNSPLISLMQSGPLGSKHPSFLFQYIEFCF